MSAAMLNVETSISAPGFTEQRADTNADHKRVGRMVWLALVTMNVARPNAIAVVSIGSVLGTVERGITGPAIDALVDILLRLRLATAERDAAGRRYVTITPLGVSVVEYRCAAPPGVDRP